MAHSASDQPDTSKMTPVSAPSPPVGAPARPSYPSAPNPLLRTPLPPTQQLQPDTLRQFYKSGTPQTRIVPLPPTANATINASAKGVATTVAKTVVATTPGAPGQITLNVPSIFTPLTQTVTLPGPLSFGLASETPGTFFQTPGPGLGGLLGTTLAQGLASPGIISISETASSIPATAFACFASGIAPGTPSGWTAINGGTFFGYQRLTSSATASASVSILNDWAAAMWIFSGTPTIVQNATRTGTSGTAPFGSNNVAGNALFVVMRNFTFSSQPLPAPAITDSLGNLYTLIIQQISNASTNRFQQYVWVAPNCKAGGNTVTFNFNDPLGHSGTVDICEIGPVFSNTAFPSFQPITGTQLPPVSLAVQGSGGVAGVLPPSSGGTGAITLSAHGVLIGEGTSAVVATGTGNSGQVLTSNGFADPTFQGIVVQVSSTSLSSAQILALLGTPVSLIPTPGPGFTILPLSISIVLFGGSAAYTDAGGAVSFNIGSATQALASNAIFTTATSPNKQIQRVAGFSATDTAGNPPTDDNAAMTISKATNNFAAGNGTAKILVHYILMPTT